MKSWTSRPVPPLPGAAAAPRVFDTSTGEPEELAARDGRAGLYVCGITPYDATHMGHAATYVTFDLLQRVWRDAGFAVDYVQNVTDVDDPLLERANATGVDWRELAESQTELFRTDMAALNVLPPDHYVGATEAVEWIVPAVERLVERGLAYRVPAGTGQDGEPAPAGDVYFDVGAAGRLRTEDPDAWVVGGTCRLEGDRDGMLPLFTDHGGDPDRTGKRNPLDPLLWRVERPGEPAWDGASLGAGRPGWHIECSVIALRHLPQPFTVQGGGSDLAFPHHDMGAGHSYALSGTPMAEHFVHTAMVGLDGEKMSKSKGNLVLVSTLRRAGVDPAAIRLAILSNHYRTDWFWTEDLLEQSQRRLATWREAAAKPETAGADAMLEAVRAALAEDLNAPAALIAVDAWAARNLGGAATRGTAASAQDTELARSTVEALLGIVL
ncbi:cysteine--1-D-myo-inosityl 2-amino-2-deoxy-alpha-D-glucopyranoside ligase [Kocuria tytonicola]|uniref:L-cysteine:1D-myo-inositol 2-amino-2-deoxy-alpha-D-glucopyranoside ligase n=1 Tax=Kocuria tytonicola TaxID=2055946 RepID=A0A3L9L815_9MICC|nr:cysteine--1-D-myo-inosityl 2-amino-2-deoxy-alpha-D-glucopyranoside ligase [Kocuria tytonicola]RLY95043.1 cysteine--1-D-myo-inosityl 2-amino-2-deoxy-alpha-D-glucopyranoside ligase [Kocuria tytonicola]RLZ03208.1 cysteine--1-D-myo-inosityl 2-amino-2-deoxy-alpha-D-glucopyranoside ligase [Kocuria tytonicola]